MNLFTSATWLLLAKSGWAVYLGFPDFVVREKRTSRMVGLSGFRGDGLVWGRGGEGARELRSSLRRSEDGLESAKRGSIVEGGWAMARSRAAQDNFVRNPKIVIGQRRHDVGRAIKFYLMKPDPFPSNSAYWRVGRRASASRTLA